MRWYVHCSVEVSAQVDSVSLCPNPSRVIPRRTLPLSFVAPPNRDPPQERRAILQRYDATAYDTISCWMDDESPGFWSRGPCTDRSGRLHCAADTPRIPARAGGLGGRSHPGAAFSRQPPCPLTNRHHPSPRRRAWWPAGQAPPEAQLALRRRAGDPGAAFSRQSLHHGRERERQRPRAKWCGWLPAPSCARDIPTGSFATSGPPSRHADSVRHATCIRGEHPAPQQA